MSVINTLKITFKSVTFATGLTLGIVSSHLLVTEAQAQSTVASTQVTQQNGEFQVRNLYVKKIANPQAKGAPIIFIPGLSSGAYVWEESVKRLQANHEIYLITLAGFHGRPVAEGATLASSKEALVELIQSQKIDRPYLVGHSLGSALSIWFAQQHSGLIRGVFGVDGLPVFPGTENVPAAQRPAMAANARQSMVSLNKETFAQQQTQYMRFMGVLNEQLADQIGAESAKSDPATVANFMGELLAMDMRADLPAITVPVAIISPYHAPDFARANISFEAKNDYYRRLMQGTPQLEVIGIDQARHFPMYDQAEQFNSHLVKFVSH